MKKKKTNASYKGYANEKKWHGQKSHVKKRSRILMKETNRYQQVVGIYYILGIITGK